MVGLTVPRFFSLNFNTPQKRTRKIDLLTIPFYKTNSFLPNALIYPSIYQLFFRRFFFSVYHNRFFETIACRRNYTSILGVTNRWLKIQLVWVLCLESGSVKDLFALT